MMGDIVSLRAKRKNKSRAEKDREAAANRAKFGQTKAEKSARQASAKRAAKVLDAHKREE